MVDLLTLAIARCYAKPTTELKGIDNETAYNFFININFFHILQLCISEIIVLEIFA